MCTFYTMFFGISITNWIPISSSFLCSMIAHTHRHTLFPSLYMIVGCALNVSKQNLNVCYTTADYNRINV